MIRTYKYGVITTLIVNPPDKRKPALTAALNYAIRRVHALIGDPDPQRGGEA